MVGFIAIRFACPITEQIFFLHPSSHGWLTTDDNWTRTKYLPKLNFLLVDKIFEYMLYNYVVSILSDLLLTLPIIYLSRDETSIAIIYWYRHVAVPPWTLKSWVALHRYDSNNSHTPSNTNLQLFSCYFNETELTIINIYSYTNKLQLLGLI